MSAGAPAVGPRVVAAAIDGLAGTTPGKFLMRLKVVDRLRRRPGLAKGLVREALRGGGLAGGRRSCLEGSAVKCPDTEQK